MWKFAVLMHMLIGSVFAGIAIIIIAATPVLADEAMTLILPSVIVAILLAIPPSIWVAKRILALTNGQ